MLLKYSTVPLLYSSLFTLKMLFNFVSCTFCTGLDKLEFLQSHENRDIYKKAYNIIEHYFSTEEDHVAPSVGQDAQQFQFTDQSVPMGGFQF